MGKSNLHPLRCRKYDFGLESQFYVETNNSTMNTLQKKRMK